MLRLLVLLVALLLVLPAAATGPWDARSGGDAPGSRAQALEIPDGAFVGRIESPTDADWYRAPVTGLGCVEARALGTTRSDFVLEVDGEALVTRLPEWPPFSQFAAARDTRDVFVGFVPAVNPTGGSPTRAGYYGFELTRRAHGELGPGDAGTGKDVGGTRGTATPVGFGCLAGRIDRPADLADAYRLQGQAGRWIGLSFAHDGAETLYLTLLGPAGERVAQLAGAGTLAVALPSTDSYTLAVTTTEDTTLVLGSTPAAVTAAGPTEPQRYVFGVTDDPGRGCRPFCNLG